MQLADRPEDLPELVSFIARRLLVKLAEEPDELASEPAADAVLMEQVDQLTAEVVDWIHSNLGRDYAWPGNFRELGQCVRNVMIGQCVRNVMIRGSYHPPLAQRSVNSEQSPIEEFVEQIREAESTKAQLLARYFAIVLDRSDGNFTAAARRLGVDPRIVKRQHDKAFLKRLQN
jgi:DNA-binding NtrC family response regulator